MSVHLINAILIFGGAAILIGLCTIPPYIYHLKSKRAARRMAMLEKAPQQEISLASKSQLIIAISCMLWGLILISFLGCSPQIRGLATEGQIIKTEPDRVFVLFEDMMGKPGHYSGNWFFIPGAGSLDPNGYYIKVTLNEIKP